MPTERTPELIPEPSLDQRMPAESKVISHGRAGRVETACLIALSKMPAAQGLRAMALEPRILAFGLTEKQLYLKVEGQMLVAKQA